MKAKKAKQAALVAKKKAMKKAAAAARRADKAKAKVAQLKKQLKKTQRALKNNLLPSLPVFVGPKNVPAKETRTVVVIGDRTANKKRWSAVKTNNRMMWAPKKLKKIGKHVPAAGKTITAVHNKVKRISEAPLVEKPLF